MEKTNTSGGIFLLFSVTAQIGFLFGNRPSQSTKSSAKNFQLLCGISYSDLGKVWLEDRFWK